MKNEYNELNSSIRMAGDTATDTALAIKTLPANNREAVKNVLTECGNDLTAIKCVFNHIRHTVFPKEACVRVKGENGKETRSATAQGLDTWLKALKHIGKANRPVPLVFTVDRDSGNVLLDITTVAWVESEDKRKEVEKADKEEKAAKEREVSNEAEKLFRDNLTDFEKLADIVKYASSNYSLDESGLLAAIQAHVKHVTEQAAIDKAAREEAARKAAESANSNTANQKGGKRNSKAA